jgi:arsenite-transporting ATPase
VVTLPEPLPVSEGLELIVGLRETEMAVGAVVANRVPVDIFTEAEREALGQLLEGHEPRGLTIVQRIQRAEGSLARLRAAVDVPIITVLDEDLEAPVPAVVQQLQGGGL